MKEKRRSRSRTTENRIAAEVLSFSFVILPLLCAVCCVLFCYASSDRLLRRAAAWSIWYRCLLQSPQRSLAPLPSQYLCRRLTRSTAHLCAQDKIEQPPEDESEELVARNLCRTHSLKELKAKDMIITHDVSPLLTSPSGSGNRTSPSRKVHGPPAPSGLTNLFTGFARSERRGEKERPQGMRARFVLVESLS